MLPGLDLDQPALGSVDGSRAACLALQQKGRPVADLRQRRIDAEVPHRCRDQVLAGLEQRSQVEALIAPVGQIAAGRAVAHPMAVDVKNEAVVGADAHRITGRHGSQLKRAAEVQRQRLSQRGRRMRGPRGLPFAVGLVGLDLSWGAVLRGKGKGDECEGEESQNGSHGLGPSDSQFPILAGNGSECGAISGWRNVLAYHCIAGLFFPSAMRFILQCCNLLFILAR